MKVYTVIHTYRDTENCNYSTNVDLYQNYEEAKAQLEHWHDSLEERLKLWYNSIDLNRLEIEEEYEKDSDSYYIYIDYYYIYDEAEIIEKEIK